MRAMLILAFLALLFATPADAQESSEGAPLAPYISLPGVPTKSSKEAPDKTQSSEEDPPSNEFRGSPRDGFNEVFAVSACFYYPDPKWNTCTLVPTFRPRIYHSAEECEESLRGFHDGHEDIAGGGRDVKYRCMHKPTWTPN